MSSFALDRASISHFNYHWFWGLRYSQIVQADNLADRLDDLIANEDLLEHLWAQQADVHQRHSMVRFLFWLFNIDSYALNTYTLASFAAYGAHQSPILEEENMPKQNMSEESQNNLRQGWIEWARNRMRNPFTECFHSENNDADSETDGFVNTSPEVNSSLPESPLYQMSQSESSPLFEVKPTMQTSLIALGIHVSNNSQLSWSYVRGFYLKAALRTHPDKPGGSSEAFHKIKAALDLLEKLISRDTITMTTKVDSWDDYFSTAIYEINHHLDKLEARVAALENKLNPSILPARTNTTTNLQNNHTSTRSTQQTPFIQVCPPNSVACKVQLILAATEEHVAQEHLPLPEIKSFLHDFHSRIYREALKPYDGCANDTIFSTFYHGLNATQVNLIKHYQSCFIHALKVIKDELTPLEWNGDRSYELQLHQINTYLYAKLHKMVRAMPWHDAQALFIATTNYYPRLAGTLLPLTEVVGHEYELSATSPDEQPAVDAMAMTTPQEEFSASLMLTTKGFFAINQQVKSNDDCFEVSKFQSHLRARL